MSDVPVGVAFAGEPFGLREGLGAVLIISAGLVVAPGRSEDSAATMD
jgi:drug/metabolite transporter (DMT)-like permease